MMKTNAMRILDQKKIKYSVHDYTESKAISGIDVAMALNQDKKKVFKTLVTVAKSGTNYVFVIPVCCELDLKRAAKLVDEKSIEMLKSKELLSLTGYVHGGCSPIGMKKKFKTVFDISVANLKSFYINGGKIGYQVEITLDDLKKVISFELGDICF